MGMVVEQTNYARTSLGPRSPVPSNRRDQKEATIVCDPLTGGSCDSDTLTGASCGSVDDLGEYEPLTGGTGI
jgi:hypothetical protein